jgi:hypothetical protein
MGVTREVMTRLMPTGAVPTHDADNATDELNPSREPTITVAEPLPPCAKMTFELDLSQKSCNPTVELVLVVVVWLMNGTETEKVTEATSSLGLPIAVTT